MMIQRFWEGNNHLQAHDDEIVQKKYDEIS